MECTYACVTEQSRCPVFVYISHILCMYVCMYASYSICMYVCMYASMLVYKCRTIIVQWFPVLINVAKMSHVRISFCGIHY